MLSIEREEMTGLWLVIVGGDINDVWGIYRTRRDAMAAIAKHTSRQAG